MEIFTSEFREELLGNLENFVVEYKSGTPFRKIIELNKKINLALEKEREIFNSKKKKKNQFEVGDVVYWGKLQGIITINNNNDNDWSLFVKFENKKTICFTKDGRYYEGLPIVLSHFPYKLKMNKIKK